MDQIKDQMPQNDLRVRPSLLNMVLPCAFEIVQDINSKILPSDLNEKLKAGMEKGIQDENDEQIRILNEKGIKSHPEIR